MQSLSSQSKNLTTVITFISSSSSNLLLVSDLEKVILTENEIENISAKSFSESLKILDLSSNKIRIIHTNAFKGKVHRLIKY